MHQALILNYKFDQLIALVFIIFQLLIMKFHYYSHLIYPFLILIFESILHNFLMYHLITYFFDYQQKGILQIM